MKIQSLAVIFVIIILPISIILSEYVHTQINTLNMQTSYDSKLYDATYDAVVAFQKNTINSTSSDITSSKIRDIEASANAFLNSAASNFGLKGNSKDALQTYIPAVVYTLYDGYYIYSRYDNTLTGINLKEGSTYNKPVTTGIKPYIYYSREYKRGSDEFIITYSLDNYITIQGKINSNVVNDSGYLIDPTQVADDGSTYRGNTIELETLSEYVDNNKDDNSIYKYVKVNGTKYYLDENNSNDDYKGRVFSYGGNERWYLSRESSQKFIEAHPFENNNNAREYYRKAKEFTNKVIGSGPEDYNLSGLKSSDGKDYSAEKQANYKVFDTNNIEYYNSEFNQERQAVIRYAIEKNLPTAIANYNNYSDSSNNFQMPNLKEDEWDKIINNISVISFMQGMNMGTKTYNGYAIVTNNKNTEVVAEESIYITTTNGEYHRATDEDLVSNSSGLTINNGVFNVDFERKTIADGDGNPIRYYYPQTQTGCYSSIVNQSGIKPLENIDGTRISIYEYMNGKGTLASKYFTALGRERKGLYRVNNIVETYSQ